MYVEMMEASEEQMEDDDEEDDEEEEEDDDADDSEEVGNIKIKFSSVYTLPTYCGHLGLSGKHQFSKLD